VTCSERQSAQKRIDKRPETFINETKCTGWLVGWLEFNVPFQHKYGYIRDELNALESTEIHEFRGS